MAGIETAVEFLNVAAGLLAAGLAMATLYVVAGELASCWRYFLGGILLFSASEFIEGLRLVRLSTWGGSEAVYIAVQVGAMLLILVSLLKQVALINRLRESGN